MVAKTEETAGGDAAGTAEGLMARAAAAERRLLRAEAKAARALDEALERLAKAQKRLAKEQARFDRLSEAVAVAQSELMACQEARAAGPVIGADARVDARAAADGVSAGPAETNGRDGTEAPPPRGRRRKTAAAAG